MHDVLCVMLMCYVWDVLTMCGMWMCMMCRCDVDDCVGVWICWHSYVDECVDACSRVGVGC